MARAGCGPFTSTSGVEREDVVHRHPHPEQVAVCGSSPSAGDESVLATARQRCPAKSGTSSARRPARRRRRAAAAAAAAVTLAAAMAL